MEAFCSGGEPFYKKCRKKPGKSRFFGVENFFKKIEKKG